MQSLSEAALKSLCQLAEVTRSIGRHGCTTAVAGCATTQKGLTVGFTTASALVNELMEARDEMRLLNLLKRLARLKLLIIDELGFVPLSRTGAELLFEVFSQRYEVLSS